MKITMNNYENLAWEKQDGLLPAIVQDPRSGLLLMQAYMNPQALEKTLETGWVTFYSRSRQCLWQKGETSGNQLEYVEVFSDCDGDSLQILAVPSGPVCHLNTATCWEGSQPPELAFFSELGSVIEGRKGADAGSSYTAKLHERGTKYIAQKVGEEAVETALAAVAGDEEEFLNESADLLYHLQVLLSNAGLGLGDVARVLKQRHS